MDNIDFQLITKIEEHRGLQFIRQTVVPSTVNKWNKAVEKSRLREKEMYKLSVEDVNKTLIKKQHHIHQVVGYGSKRDWIQYESIPIKPFKFKGPFQFSLFKDSIIGELIVRAALPGSGSENFISYYIEATDHNKVFNNLQPIRRGIHIKEAIEKSGPFDIHHFSKKEEGECVQFIKLVVLPYLVDRKNKILNYANSKKLSSAQSKRPIKLRLADVQHSFRKISERPTKHGINLIYRAEGQNQIYELALYKDGEGDILVWNRSNGQQYQVGKPIKPSVEDDYTEGTINEAGTGPTSIRKIEEAELLQNIRTYVIPIAAFIWNKKIKIQSHPYRNFDVASKEIEKNLKKFNHHIHTNNDKTTTDVIHYKSVVELPRFEFNFQCFKQVNNSNKIIVEITFPDSTCKYVDTHGSLVLVEGSETKLSETVDNTQSHDETGLERISLREEKEALQYIRQYILPIAVKSYNETIYYKSNQVTEQEVQQNLRLSGRYPQQIEENPSISFVSVPRGKYFAFLVHKQLQKKSQDFGKMHVICRTPDAIIHHSYVVGIPPKALHEGFWTKRDVVPRWISKIAEHEALQYIRNRLIPAAFKCYNDHVMGEFRVNHESDIRKLLRKINVDYRHRDNEETIYYEALVPTAGGRRVQKFTFYITKPNTPGMLNRIRCGVNIANYVAQEFYVGEPAYMT